VTAVEADPAQYRSPSGVELSHQHAGSASRCVLAPPIMMRRST